MLLRNDIQRILPAYTDALSGRGVVHHPDFPWIFDRARLFGEGNRKKYYPDRYLYDDCGGHGANRNDYVRGSV